MKKIHDKQINITIDKLNRKKELTINDYDVLNHILTINSRYIKFKFKLNIKLCIYISELYECCSEERLKWLKLAEEVCLENSSKKMENLLNFKIGKYYYYCRNYDNGILENSKKYFDMVKHAIPDALYYLGCILMIEEVTTKDLGKRNYQESYRYLKVAVDRGVKDAEFQRDFVKSLLND